ncbi:MAG TPA: histidine kinase, partial [Burkholderiaceae bacterium]
MDRLDRLLNRVAQPGMVLRIAAAAVCLLELVAAIAALMGRRTDAYDGIFPNLYRRLGGGTDDLGLLIACLALVLLFAISAWRMAATPTERSEPLGQLIGLNALALAVTPGLPFLVTALAAVQLRLRSAFTFALAQIGIGLTLYLLLPSDSQRLELLNSDLPLWLNLLSQLMALVALHGMAFGLGRMAAAEAEKRRWLQAMLAERLSAEHMQAEQLRYAERTLMARELHDVVGHHLTALNLQLQLG